MTGVQSDDNTSYDSWVM